MAFATTKPYQSVVARTTARGVTPRQRQLLILVAAGYTRSQMHEELGVGRNTVSNYMDALRNRLIPNTTAGKGARYPMVVNVALARGLITLTEILEAMARREGVTVDQLKSGW